ncbi:hypothetical protein D5400_09550 [Georhizobium profundi]|uniref:CheB-type methylesterase domain-containing protein n=1 Tax=Georhizobium profundi TaxID=2341112 RepID=A0A3S9B3F8_9HYPH|nr:hypothetical protein D5400_09550 [Georhizobium profundi]
MTAPRSRRMTMRVATGATAPRRQGAMVALCIRWMAASKDNRNMSRSMSDQAASPSQAASQASVPMNGSGPTNIRVVAIGASAGGLEACRGLLHALPPMPDTACLLVQHLDPWHESLLADLLRARS